jgi:hypothetical protein
MRRSELYWGGLLIVLGGLFSLKAAGYLTGDVFSWVWPLLIMAAGGWILLDGAVPPSASRSAKFSIPLQGARQASLGIDHGAGEIELSGGADSGDFLTGVAGLGLDRSAQLNGDKLQVQLHAGPTFLPFLGPSGGVWKFRIDSHTPTSLRVDAGASSLKFDLSDTQVNYFSFDGGAARLDLSLPASVDNMLVDVEIGAARFNLHVPKEVALRLRANSVGPLSIDEKRFPRREGNVYESADYAASQYHAEVTVDGGATVIRVD